MIRSLVKWFDIQKICVATMKWAVFVECMWRVQIWNRRNAVILCIGMCCEKRKQNNPEKKNRLFFVIYNRMNGVSGTLSTMLGTITFGGFFFLSDKVILLIYTCHRLTIGLKSRVLCRHGITTVTASYFVCVWGINHWLISNQFLAETNK